MAENADTDELQPENLEPEVIEQDEPETIVETTEGEDGETVWTFGDEAAPASGEGDSSVIRQMRDQLRAAQKRVNELEATAPKPQAIDPGPRPQIEDFDYSQEHFDAALDKWLDDTAQAKVATAEAGKAKEAAESEWKGAMQSFAERRTALNVPDLEDVEATVVAALGEERVAAIVGAGLTDAAKLLYALGKNPAKLAELAKLNPLKAAVAAGKLEDKLKVGTKAPSPERLSNGNVRSAPGTDKELERLEAKANRTGDRSELIAYKASLKSKA